MSNTYNIEINTLDGKRITLGAFNINKTDLKDIKNKLQQIHGHDKDGISFTYIFKKENTVSIDAFISEEISHHKEFGNQYIDHLKIREVLDHLELYGTPEDSHIFTDIGAKQLKEKEETKALINHYRYFNPEYLERIWRSNKAIGTLFCYPMFLMIPLTFVGLAVQNLVYYNPDKEENLVPKQFIDNFLFYGPLLITGFLLSFGLDSIIGYNSKVFAEKTTLLSNLIIEEPHTLFYDNQKYKRFLEITSENNQRINILLFPFSSCHRNFCDVLNKEYYRPPQGINTTLRDLKNELDKIEKNEQKEKISREIENNINNELEESLLGVCTL